MDAVLLATKVRIPPLVHRVLPRARLIDALESGIPHYKLILLSSPAGYGKTTLLSQWAIESQYQVVWLSLDETDGDLERFINYLLAAWETVQPEIMEGKLGVLLGSRMPDNQTILSEIINAAADLPQQMAIVLDDYHLIEDASIHEALAYLLDHLPQTMCFILATRAEPPLPLARYRAKRALLELGIQDLQFVQQETAEFLTEMMGLDLAQDEVSSIQNRLEGWIVGLQLIALAWRHQGGNGDELVTSGRHRFIADFLRDDVLAHIPDAMQHFLLQTSILDRLCGSLCDAVTEAENSQQMVEKLEAGNLFLLPLDDQREWFRYHHLFADFLYQELRRRHPDDVADLHRRAAHWHLAHDLPDQAFAHTVRAEDGDIMQEIFERHFIPSLLLVYHYGRRQG